MSFVKTAGAALLLLGVMVSPSAATTFNISLTENNLGDAGADWFGTFEAPTDGGLITSFTLTVSGVLYNRLTAAGYNVEPVYISSTNSIAGAWFDHFGFVMSGPDVYLAPAIAFHDEFGTSVHGWNRSSCGAYDCGGGFFQGTYSISPATVVPLPAALPLLAGGLGLMGIVNWLRKRKAA
jgi:hypothetical protein